VLSKASSNLIEGPTSHLVVIQHLEQQVSCEMVKCRQRHEQKGTLLGSAAKQRPVMTLTDCSAVVIYKACNLYLQVSSISKFRI
jgi:hypothetical protein